MRNRSAFGWGELVVGIALVVLGIFTFARPSSALTGIVFVYGLLAVVTGIADIAFYVKIERHTGVRPGRIAYNRDSEHPRGRPAAV